MVRLSLTFSIGKVIGCKLNLRHEWPVHCSIGQLVLGELGVHLSILQLVLVTVTLKRGLLRPVRLGPAWTEQASRSLGDCSSPPGPAQHFWVGIVTVGWPWLLVWSPGFRAQLGTVTIFGPPGRRSRIT